MLVLLSLFLGLRPSALSMMCRVISHAYFLSFHIKLGHEAHRESECLFSHGQQNVSLSLQWVRLIVPEVVHIISSFLVLARIPHTVLANPSRTDADFWTHVIVFMSSIVSENGSDDSDALKGPLLGLPEDEGIVFFAQVVRVFARCATQASCGPHR